MRLLLFVFLAITQAVEQVEHAMPRWVELCNPSADIAPEDRIRNGVEVIDDIAKMVTNLDLTLRDRAGERLNRMFATLLGPQTLPMELRDRIFGVQMQAELLDIKARYLLDPILGEAFDTLSGWSVQLESAEGVLQRAQSELQEEDPVKAEFERNMAQQKAWLNLAEGADILLCNISHGNKTPPPDNSHMTAEQAGKLGYQAGAKALWLSHYPPDFLPRELLQAAIKGAMKAGAQEEILKGWVYLAHDGQILRLTKQGLVVTPRIQSSIQHGMGRR